MSVEFRLTSEFRELAEIAEARNASPEWRGVLEIKPSVTRVVKLRGRLPLGSDTSDIHYDLRDFARIDISSSELAQRLSHLTELESTYYPLAENFAKRAAFDSSLPHRFPDFIDAGKDLVAYSVWHLWRPEKGEDFVGLHRRIKALLNRALKAYWYSSSHYLSYSNMGGQELLRASAIEETDDSSWRPKPRTRLRRAAQHLSLPSIVATVDECEPLEQIASLAVMGYYPDGRGLSGIAEHLGIWRNSLASALNSALERLSEATDGGQPKRAVSNMVKDLLDKGLIRYPSGKYVEKSDPRLDLLRIRALPNGLYERDRKILELAVARRENVFIYSAAEIGQMVGLCRSQVCLIIKTLACSLQQTIH